MNLDRIAENYAESQKILDRMRGNNPPRKELIMTMKAEEAESLSIGDIGEFHIALSEVERLDYKVRVIEIKDVDWPKGYKRIYAEWIND